MLLAGANTVQTVSSIYKFGFSVVSKMLEELDNWMKEHNYSKISDFRGKMSKQNIKSPFAYRRAQYVDILLHSDDILKEHSLS